MRQVITLGTACVIAVGSLTCVGCEDTVRKEETVKTSSNGTQTRTETKTVREPDGDLRTERSTEKTRVNP